MSGLFGGTINSRDRGIIFLRKRFALLPRREIEVRNLHFLAEIDYGTDALFEKQ